MFQILTINQDQQNHINLDVLLDSMKVDAGGNPDRNYIVHLQIPAPAKGVSIDLHMAQQLPLLSAQLTATLTVRQPPVDPFAKWRGHTWT